MHSDRWILKHEPGVVMNMRARDVSFIFLFLNFSAANAAIIYDEPGRFTVSTLVDDNIVVEHGEATVVVDSGGVVRGNNTSPFGAVRTLQGDLAVVGTGRVIAGSARSAIHLGSAASVVRIGDRATVVGNITADNTAYEGNPAAQFGLFLQDQSAVIGDIRYGGYLHIEDQAIVHGNVVNASNGNIGVDMSGGTITGTLQMGAGNMMFLDLEGGSVLGGVRGLWGDLFINMSGGAIDGGFWTGAAVNGDISGGRIADGVLIDAYSYSNLGITGGQFDTALDNWLFQFASDSGVSSGQGGLLEISGGQFGYAGAGRGFLIDDSMDLTIHGRDLVYSDGWLTGYLQDGNWFSNQLTFGSNWTGAFTIHNVPEPGTWALLAAGLIGVGFGRRRRSRGVAGTV